MNKTKMILVFIGFWAIMGISCSADSVKNKAVFIEEKDVFKETLKRKTGQVSQATTESKPVLKMDLTGIWIPTSPEQFQQCWHHSSRSQDLTGNCWAFSAVSFLESEIYRLQKKDIRLSDMYLAYWEYVEKAREFVRTKGQTEFTRGSQSNATLRVIQKHGIIPQEQYSCLNSPNDIYNDDPFYSKMKSYLETVKQKKEWDEKKVISNIQSILNQSMGEPPKKVIVNGKDMTPMEYYQNIVRLNPEDYICVMSLMEKPFYKMGEYPVSDNWWHSQEYYNLPLDKFMEIIKKGIRNGYTMCIVGDNSEPGFVFTENVALIPDFDIPSQDITDSARQYRFTTELTTDDHAIHLVGYLEKDGKDWYLINDSGTKSRNGKIKGYMFYDEDFVKLKMMYIMIHKDALKGIIEINKDSQ